ncbi:MAG: GTP-binding protein [Flavonifractor plautii]
MTDQSKIRNFSIIAHIDHGKSTLSDRLLSCVTPSPSGRWSPSCWTTWIWSGSGASPSRPGPSRWTTRPRTGGPMHLNLIDTPGHVDFNYEVSRSLAACEGAVLVVDSTQGVEAQTLANTYLALEHDLEILPVFNKIDLPAADPQKAKHEVEDIIGLPALDAPEISAKQGINIPAVLEDIVQNVPAPDRRPGCPAESPDL